MSVTITCTRCKATMTGSTEYATETLFNQHTCKDMRSLRDIPFDLLTEIVHNRMTEAEAWQIADSRTKEVTP